jgi:hypothetical protein
MAGESVAVLPLEFTPDFIVENSPPGVQNRKEEFDCT